MKRILYLSFYFKPDLSAGSFRNTSLAYKLAGILSEKDQIDVFTTIPNRYSSFNTESQPFEQHGNLTIHRIEIPKHKGNFTGQIKSFAIYYLYVLKHVRKIHYDKVFASSSRLFTAFLGARIASKMKVPLYLDIRDIFVDTMNDVFKNKFLKFSLIPFLKIIERYTFNRADHINLVSEGFKPYFEKFRVKKFTFFTNGIDDEFLTLHDSEPKYDTKLKILYAGNIGEGQGLEKILPPAAKMLGTEYQFIVIGDGGTLHKLKSEIEKNDIKNIELIMPVERKKLIDYYYDSDFLFIHLNDYKAFEKVLPSKIFEIGAFDKPIIAGLSGYSRKFLQDNIENCIIFNPGDVESMVRQIRSYKYVNLKRIGFIEKFKRDKIMLQMAYSINE